MARDWQTREYRPPDAGSDRGRWQVHLALEPGEKEAIARAAPLVVPAENFEIHTELLGGGVEGDVLLALRVFASSEQEAVEQAQYVLSKIRREAELSPVPSTVLGFISPWWHRHSRAEHIAKEAHELHAQGRHELAVMRIQTAIEVRIRSSFARLLRDRDPGLVPDRLVRRSPTLQDDQTRELLYLLTGRRVQEEPWWSAYVAHYKRRNEIVHGGLEIAHDDAYASLEAAVNMHAFLLELAGASVLDDANGEDDEAGPRSVTESSEQG